MTEQSSTNSKPKVITIENFMTEEEKVSRNRKKLNELDVLRSELNSGKINHCSSILSPLRNAPMIE